MILIEPLDKKNIKQTLKDYSFYFLMWFLYMALTPLLVTIFGTNYLTLFLHFVAIVYVFKIIRKYDDKQLIKKDENLSDL